MQRSLQPRHRLTAIIDRLPRGGYTAVANRVQCAVSTAYNVLNGYQSQQTDIARSVIRVAECLAKTKH